MENYQALALATLAFNETYEQYVDIRDFHKAVAQFSKGAVALEDIKKQIAYGRNLPSEPAVSPITPENVNILHAKLGIAGEAGEVFDATTKDEVIAEVGDLLWYIAILLAEYDVDFPEVMQKNIEKLNNRYKSGKFTQSEALNRPD